MGNFSENWLDMNQPGQKRLVVKLNKDEEREKIDNGDNGNIEVEMTEGDIDNEVEANIEYQVWREGDYVRCLVRGVHTAIWWLC